jgi:recombination protein RecA
MAKTYRNQEKVNLILPPAFERVGIRVWSLSNRCSDTLLIPNQSGSTPPYEKPSCRRWSSVPSGLNSDLMVKEIERKVLMANEEKKLERATLDRAKALDTALAQIERQFGKGSVMKMGDRGPQVVEVIPTGSIALDIALGIGGLPRGRIVEIYGPESSGKTTVALHAIANAQKNGGIAAFIDAEHALDPEYARKLGVDIDALLVSQPDTGEQALEIMDMLIRSGALDIVVVDSVAALVPRAEIEGEMGDSHMGLQARLMSQALRKITGALHSSNTTAIFINQLRDKIGVFFGTPETTTGGKALKFYASIRLDVRRIETLKDGQEAVGNRTRVKVVKNKMAPPFKQAEFDIIYGVGISREGSLIDLGVEVGVVKKSGAWYTYESDQLGQGKENARAFLIDNPDLANDIEAKIRAHYVPVAIDPELAAAIDEATAEVDF